MVEIVEMVVTVMIVVVMVVLVMIMFWSLMESKSEQGYYLSN